MPGRPIVTTLMVPAIREERALGGWTVQQIAARYGVSPATVSRITRGITYPDLPGPIIQGTHQAKQKTCLRGHRLDHTNRRGGTRWRDCRSCHTIRNRKYRQRKAAAA